MIEDERWSKIEALLRRVLREEFATHGFKSKTKLSFVNGKWTGLTEEQLSAWQAAYPSCNLQTELKRAAAWILSNPTSAPKSNYARFMNTWLSRQQNQASLRAIPTARSVANKVCAYCERPASGSCNGYEHCANHQRDAMDGIKPTGKAA
jgi:hypothetical protein